MKKAPRTDRPKRAAIYREAAIRVEKCDQQTCLLLEEMTGKWPQDYARLFSPVDFSDWVTNPCYRYGLAIREHRIGGEQLHDFRVTSLCFMAAMVEAGDA